MSDFKVTVSIEIKQADGSVYRHEETKTSTSGGNPLFLAQHAELAIQDVGEAVAASVPARFGDIRTLRASRSA